MQPVTFTTTPDADGRLPESRRDQIRRALRARAGRETLVTIGDPVHTTNATRFYWGFRVRPVAEGLVRAGFTFEEVDAEAVVRYVPPTDEIVHAYWKRKYLGHRIVTIDGEETLLPATTTTLTVDDMFKYVLDCETDRLTELSGTYLPSPGEAGFSRPFKSGRIEEPDAGWRRAA